MIDAETIDKIFETARIEEIIGDFVDLKKRGVNYLGRCPFHNEKTPSFTVSPTKGIYKCFGCGKGGNVVNFVMEIEHYNYPEALKYIANKYSIEVVENELTFEQKTKKNKKDNHYLITDYAKEIFKKNLSNNEGKNIALRYFKERGISEHMIEKFELGYAMSNPSFLTNSALKNNYKPQLLIDAGLSLANENNNKIIDRFIDRIIFPIHSFTGRVLGFGGRALKESAKAKYLNSPETLIYHKSKVLYGLFQSKTEIKKEDNCYIVEGYTDVISLFDKGVKNVVSASGTALGVEQLRLISRITENITLMFDADDAGIKATYRTIDLALQEGLEVNVVIFPDGEDPDSFSKNNSEEELKLFLQSKKLNFIDYKILISKLNSIIDPKEITIVKRNIFSSVAQINDTLVRSEYCKMYAKKLNVKEEIMLKEITNIRANINFHISKKNNTRLVNKSKNITDKTKLYTYEEEIIRLLINYGNEKINFNNSPISVAEMIINDLKIDNICFSHSILDKIYKKITSEYSTNNIIDFDKLIKENDNEINSLVINLISNQHSISVNWKEQHKIFTAHENQKMQKTTEKAILSLKKCHLEIKIKKLQEKINRHSEDVSLLKELTDLTKIKTEIAKILGRNVG
tara:strand:- start:9112 stop:11001 length:1890 start_codon:yes stop_codon:yes gene_type:complete